MSASILMTIGLAVAASFAPSAFANGPKHEPQPVVITNVKVTPTNGGINPDFFAYNISGQVMQGATPCIAALHEVSLEQKTEGGTVIVTAFRTFIGTGDEVCTMEYNPVYTTVETTVRASHSLVSDVVVENVGAMGSSLDADDGSLSKPITVSSVTSTPVNAGINPDAFALKIEGTVMKGENPCIADNNQVALVQVKRGSVIEVTATLELSNTLVACTREWDPVYVQIETTIRDLRSQTSDVVVKNVDEMGNDVSAFTLVP